jgi:hypothetical protein
MLQAGETTVWKAAKTMPYKEEHKGALSFEPQN